MIAAISQNRREADSQIETLATACYPAAMPSDTSAAGPAGARTFATTHWSVVLAARGATPAAREALAKLCRDYWYPLYAFVRREGYGAHDAQDFTQEFLARLIEKEWLAGVAPERGRFRSWLLAAMKHFLANEWVRAQRLKRGGAQEFVSLDAEERYAREPSEPAAAENLYDRRWALDVLDRGLARLAAEQAAAGKAEQFAALKFCLTGDKTPLAEVAAQHRMSEGAVKVAAHRLRERYRALIREEIAATVATDADVETELQELMAALRS
jgi:RNA polymerase sigma-70 factor (ECF subfamily)